MTERLFEDIMIYYGVINALTLALFLLDKLKARGGMRRIRERTLLFAAAVGGAGGAGLGMALFRHKTRKPKFLLLVPLFLLLHLGAIGFMWFIRCP